MSEDLGLLLRTRRKQCKLSQSQLANLSGVSARTLRYWESGEKVPRVVELQSVLQAMGINPQEALYYLSLIKAPRGHQHIKLSAEAALHPPVFMSHPGDLMRAMRVRKGASQQWLATQLGVSLTTIMRWETMRNAPSEQNLERFCALLNANAEEAFLLVRKQLSSYSGELYSDIDSCQQQLNSIIKAISLHQQNVELSILILQRKLSQLSLTEPEAVYMLARSRMSHAHALNLNSQTTEAKRAVRHSLELFRSVNKQDDCWALALNLASNFVGKSKQDYLGKVSFLKQHLMPGASGPMRLRMYCDMSLYLTKAGRNDEAKRLLIHAHRELQSLGDDEGHHHYYELSSGRVYLALGMLDRAMNSLKTITEHDPNDPFYLCYQAEAALLMGERHQGFMLASRASTIANASPFAYVRTRVDEFLQTSGLVCGRQSNE